MTCICQLLLLQRAGFNEDPRAVFLDCIAAAIKEQLSQSLSNLAYLAVVDHARSFVRQHLLDRLIPQPNQTGVGDSGHQQPQPLGTLTVDVPGIYASDDDTADAAMAAETSPDVSPGSARARHGGSNTPAAQSAGLPEQQDPQPDLRATSGHDAPIAPQALATQLLHPTAAPVDAAQPLAVGTPAPPVEPTGGNAHVLLRAELDLAIARAAELEAQVAQYKLKKDATRAANNAYRRWNSLRSKVDKIVQEHPNGEYLVWGNTGNSMNYKIYARGVAGDVLDELDAYNLKRLIYTYLRHPDLRSELLKPV